MSRSRRWSRQLAKQLRHSRVVAHWTKLLALGWLAFALLGFAVAPVMAHHLAALDLDEIDWLCNGLLTLSATLGGLATTLFFLTAQLRVAGIDQYGLTSMYRFRDFAPLLGSTVFILVSVTAAMAVGSPGRAWMNWLSAIAVAHVPAFLLTIWRVAALAILNFDTVSVARRFSARIASSDAEEWGLFSISRRVTPPKGVEIRINSNRMNFGLRDPLMPIHELILKANAKRFGQVLGVMLERASSEYGLRWEEQAPDPAEWSMSISGNGAGRILRWRFRRFLTVSLEGVERENEVGFLTERRLQTLMLMLHYVRRVPRNDQVHDVPLDDRRQNAQFQLSRLGMTFTVAGITGEAPKGVSPDELRIAAVLCVYAVGEIALDHRDKPPIGQMEASWCLAYLANAMKKAGWHGECGFTLQVLAWIAANTQQLAGWRFNQLVTQASEVAGFDAELAARLRDLPNQIGLDLPSLPSVPNPWISWRSKTRLPS